MPHECTNCGRTFPDGSKEMLSGCPDCGGNKFKFEPASRRDSTTSPDDDPTAGTGGAAERSSSSRGGNAGTGADVDADTDAGTGTDTSTGTSTGTGTDSGTSTDTTDDPFESHEWPDTASTTPPDAHDKTGRAGEPTLDPDHETREPPSGGRTDTREDHTGADSTRHEGVHDGRTRNTDERSSDVTDERSSDVTDERSSDVTDERSSDVDDERISRAGTADDRATSPDTSPDRPGSVTGDSPHANVETGGSTTDRRDADGADDANTAGVEDAAQADARSAVVSGDELPGYGDDTGNTGDTTSETSDTSPKASDTPPRTSDTSHRTTDDSTPPTTTGPAGETDETAPESPPDRTSGDHAVDDPAAGDPAEPPVDSEFERIRDELNEQFESIRIVRPGEYELNLVELYDREEFIISLREDGRYVIEMPEAWDSPDD